MSRGTAQKLREVGWKDDNGAPSEIPVYDARYDKFCAYTTTKTFREHYSKICPQGDLIDKEVMRALRRAREAGLSPGGGENPFSPDSRAALGSNQDSGDDDEAERVVETPSGSDRALEMQVLKSILIREGFLRRLREVVALLQRGERAAHCEVRGANLFRTFYEKSCLLSCE